MVAREDRIGLRKECVCVCVLSSIYDEELPYPHNPQLKQFLPSILPNHSWAMPAASFGKVISRVKKKNTNMGGKSKRTEAIRDEAKSVAVPEFP